MRLVTRADFDGLACGALITLMEEIDSYLFVEPKFMQDGVVEVRAGDIIANLPYRPGCTLWFDHHITNAESWQRHLGPEAGAEESIVPGKGGFRLAPSAAGIVYEYYNALAGNRLRPRRIGLRPKRAIGDRRFEDSVKILKSDRIRTLVEETDKIDAGKLTPRDVLHPDGYVLVSMTVDGKRPEDEPYWMRVIELLRDAPLEEMLRDPEVKRRCQELLAAQERLKGILLERTTLKGNVIYVDLRGIEDVPDGNRFLLYTLFPTGNISLKIADDSQRPNTTAISVGYNIFNTTSRVNVGALLEKYGGGGHRVVGSFRVPNLQSERAIAEILEAIKE
ncbi:MAG: exopolyphosphatase [Deltaproteobacteria bacterium]|nr:exopolyphosphatase [Deltaproteobacteria bacterium]